MIDALKNHIKVTVPDFKLVGDAIDFQSAAESNPVATPACFVFVMTEDPKPPQTDVLIQRVEVAVGIVFVVKNLKDAKGSAARVTLDGLRKQVKEQLFGWQVSAEHDPFARGSSRLLTFRDGHVWWQDLYLTSYFDRSLL